jgi:conjugative relaxase-like TrwC/TraI family protein
VVSLKMLRIVQNSSASRAKGYYSSPSSADYYSQGQELVGNWHGKGAAWLGLSGAINKKTWDRLCDNRHPETGEFLTPRQKQKRRVGYDINFHVPKSVSLLYTQDDRIFGAFLASVDETMRDMESEVKTRVRSGGKNEDRVTGNLIWGEFVHTTARPINGIPDPHLHAHCFAFNLTFDDHENRWKAADFSGLKRDANFFEALFHSRMARRMEELGLPVERTKKGWEIAGITKASLDKFSRRTALIEKMAKEQGITDAAEKSELGAKTREHKQKNLSMDDLRKEWRGRLSDVEQSTLGQIAERIGSTPIPENAPRAREAVLLATQHCFERKSVVAERELLSQALKRSYGLASPHSVEEAVREQNLITAERDGRKVVTTREVLNEEQRMTDFARRGRGACPRLAPGPHEFREVILNEGQRQAVLHVGNSPDRVIMIRGVAGVGKTKVMREAVSAIEANGKKVFTFAPSADASRGVLREQEGFHNADTVARLLVDEKLQQQVKGNVMWIDEAGLLGTRTMAQLFDLADRLDARVILSGDRRQHGSVERGSALWLLETEAGIVPAEIRTIQRQKGAYKDAVQALSEGRIQDGFQKLDDLGWIREVGAADRYQALAADYVTTVMTGKSALVVSPTHMEGEQITDEIRIELRRAGKLGKEQRQFTILTNANLTQAERRDAVNYYPGDVLVFHQNAKGFTRGQRVVVGDAPLPLDQADRFQMYYQDSLPLAVGDVVRITANGKTADSQHRLNNGALYTVAGFTDSGDIRLTNGWTIARDFGHIDHGYVVTSHASQGKTVDRIFIGQSSLSDPAASREQFYVSVSRGREQATIYTDDKRGLREAVQQTDDRLTATEIASDRERSQRMAILRQMERHNEITRKPARRHEVTYER